MRQTREDLEGGAVSHSRGAIPARPGPRSMTIADSMVLVIGVAVALALPWYNGWVQTPQPVMWPRWMIILYFFEEAVGKASLALIPLMLYRRARFGGISRPGELLLVACASRVIADEVARVSDLELSVDGILAGESYWASLRVAAVAFILAVTALILFRRRLSDFVITSLLVIAVAGSYPLADLSPMAAEQPGDRRRWDPGFGRRRLRLLHRVLRAGEPGARHDRRRGGLGCRHTPIPYRSDGRNRPGIGGDQSGRYAGGGLAVKLHRVLAAVERSPAVRAARRAGGRCTPGLQRRLSHPASQCPMVCPETRALPGV
jgi:hypothetical protein